MAVTLTGNVDLVDKSQLEMKAQYIFRLVTQLNLICNIISMLFLIHILEGVLINDIRKMKKASYTYFF